MAGLVPRVAARVGPHLVEEARVGLDEVHGPGSEVRMDAGPKRRNPGRLAAGVRPRPGPVGAAASVVFSGYTWTVKASTSKVGPGPNLFSAANVTVGEDGLHLGIRKRRAGWTCAEVIAQGTFGYGTYRGPWPPM